MFLGLLDPDQDPFIRSTDPDQDPSVIKQKWLEKPLFLLFCDFFTTFYDVNVLSKSNKYQFFVGIFLVKDENSRIRIH
jgi:hypothetical protein